MTNIIETMARAMQESRAWPAVYSGGTAEVLARAALAALTEAGFAIVPVEPTLEMSSAGLEAIIDLHCGEAPAAYRAMIEAGRVKG
ncbi:hypothetical protein [Sphingopyxis sp. NJF-3]